jgi:hypothetical protein
VERGWHPVLSQEEKQKKGFPVRETGTKKIC